VNALFSSAPKYLRSSAAYFFIFAVVLSTLAYGSVREGSTNVSVIAFGLLAAASLCLPIADIFVSRVYFVGILLFAALTIYVVAQALPFPFDDFVNGAWKAADELAGPVRVTISAAPGVTMAALSKLALPFLVFLSALALFQGDTDAVSLWRALAYFGAGYALFGILQDVFFPEQLLFAQKKYYLGYLTASFVNRNSAGTFFGLALLCNFGLLFYELRRIRASAFFRKMVSLDMSWWDGNARVVQHALLCLVVAVALFLTQSRGAVGATFVACAGGIILIGLRPFSAERPTRGASPLRRYALIIVGLVVVVGLFALFAGRSVYRMEAQGSEDARWCTFASTFEAIENRPIAGAGFGTFQDVFPAYRNADCAGIYYVWDRAHNFFLEGYLGLGLAFAAALLVGYFVLVFAFVRGIRGRDRLRSMPVMGAAALILTSLHSLVDFSLQIPGVAVYFAALMASAATISSRGRRPPLSIGRKASAKLVLAEPLEVR
jgi:O-antigen ligase